MPSSPPHTKPQYKFFSASVITIERPARDIAVIKLKLNEGSFSFKAGQYAYIKFGDHDPRPYSLASGPDKAYVEVHIKDSRENGASSYVCNNLQVGEATAISAPVGINIFDPAHYDDKPLLLIGGGLGFTPLKAIIDTALAGGNSPVTFFWGTKTKEALYLDDYFRGLATKNEHFSYYSVIGNPVIQAVCEQIQDLSDFRIYLGGPPVMIEHTVPRLIKQGAVEDNISYDSWTI